MARFLVIAVAVCCLSGCSRREGLNFDCQWVADQDFKIWLSTDAHVRHLLDDLQTAEELAVRYGDRTGGWRLVDTFGIISRHGGLKDREAGRLAKQTCTVSLLDTIGAIHGLTAEDIARVQPRLAERGLDLPVTIPVIALFALALRSWVRWLRNRFQSDEWVPWAVATVFGSVILTAVILAIGAGWALLVEIVRLGNEHVGARARTADLRGNFLIMFGAGIAATWAVSAIVNIRLASGRR